MTLPPVQAMVPRASPIHRYSPMWESNSTQRRKVGLVEETVDRLRGRYWSDAGDAGGTLHDGDVVYLQPAVAMAPRALPIHLVPPSRGVELHAKTAPQPRPCERGRQWMAGRRAGRCSAPPRVSENRALVWNYRGKKEERAREPVPTYRGGQPTTWVPTLHPA